MDSDTSPDTSPDISTGVDATEALARRIESHRVFGPVGAADVAEHAARVRAGGSPLHVFEERALSGAFDDVIAALDASDAIDLIRDIDDDSMSFEVEFEDTQMPGGVYRVSLSRVSDEPW